MSLCCTNKFNDLDREVRLKFTQEYYDKVFAIIEPLGLVDSRLIREIEHLLKVNKIDLNVVDYLLSKEL